MQKRNTSSWILASLIGIITVLPSNKIYAISGTNDDTYGKNGVAYILLSSESASPGVYRMNKYDGSLLDDYDRPWRVFKTDTITGKISGLSANQRKQVFLLSAREGDGFYDAPVGWLPTGIKFDENSPIYIAVAGPSDGGATDYKRSGYPSWHSWPTNGNPDSGQYWKRDQKYTSGNTEKSFEYAVNFGGPVGVKFLNGKNGTVGTPVWDGTFWPESTSNAAAIKHPNTASDEPTKIILPSHCAALSYYLYGTKNEPSIQGLPMDGTDGREEYIFTQANGAGYFGGDSKHKAGTMFGCLVKRIYQKRDNSLDLYTGNDTTEATTQLVNGSMRKTQSGVLATTDVKVRESYGKLCGDNCIDGGEIAGNKPIETALSTVTVVTSTKGNRYGFNPVGTCKGSNSTDASLRVVDINNNTKVIDISTDNEGNVFSDRITNRTLLVSQGVTPSSMRTIGVSTNYKTEDGEDFIYGSQADHFVVQDSWWGLGGIAYEYYKGEDDNSGKIVKTDYMANENPTPEVVSTSFSGKIDSIGIDGDGYLYALKTEESPSDEEMRNICATTGASSIDTSSYTPANGYPNSLDISYSGWKRDVTTTTSTGETINNPTIDIQEGSQKPGDYKIATVYQKVYKAIKRYPQGTGSLGTEESRGYLEVGVDTWTNNLKLNSSGALTWDFDVWRQCSEAERASCVPAELAVVNVAASPISIEGSAKKYICVTKIENETDSPTYTPGQVINEQDTLTFKVEGYLPVIDGKQTAFKHVGKIGNRFNDVYLNSIPAKDGKYEHDEDNDGNRSGFPSSMFEGSDDYKTLVTWEIAQVEDTTPVPLKNAKLITPIETIPISESDITFKSAKYKFKQPGRYILQATVTFNYFSNFKTAKNPTELEASTETFTTEPYMVCVVANELNLNNSVSYINNISIKMLDNNVPVAHKNYDNTDGQSLNIIDATFNEDKPFGNKDIRVSFDAQFAWVENDNTGGNLNTHSGIGVWEYDYYRHIYGTYLKGCTGVEEPTGLPTSKAYNNIGGNAKDPKDVFSTTIYNPGRKKESDDNPYTAGTTINKEPTDDDKKFIQWALYLVPVKANEINPLQPTGLRERGECIARGDCVGAKFISKSNGKYEVKLDIPDSEINVFKTPRDPQYYTLALEIVYPRVSWLNNDLGYGDGRKYYSSLVPYGSSDESINNSPVHVISKIGNCPSNGNYINQSNKNKLGQSLFNEDKDYLLICARDNTAPTFYNITHPNGQKDIEYVIETTGDAKIEPVSIKCAVSDNNPFLSTDKSSNDFGLDNSINAFNNETSGVKLLIQSLKDEESFENGTTNLIFTESTEPNERTITSECEINTLTDYYKNDVTMATFSYEAKITSIAPFCHVSPTEITKDNLNERTFKLELDNWVGELAYFWEGEFYDGFGANGAKLFHTLYNKNVNNELTTDPEKALIKEEPITFFKRIDNDPPTIEVELISQNDNKRWKYQLIEAIKDNSNNPQTASDLGSCNLYFEQFSLLNSSVSTQEEKVVPETQEEKVVPGAQGPALAGSKTKNGILSGGTHEINIQSYLPIPSVRKASRLLINVNIFDNCGFKDLSAATIEITDSVAGNEQMSPKEIRLDPSHNMNGNFEKFEEEPRGTFYFNAPMRVSQEEGPQLKIKVFTADDEGNERSLVIPVNVVDSSFKTRVLETKESRQ